MRTNENCKGIKIKEKKLKIEALRLVCMGLVPILDTIALCMPVHLHLLLLHQPGEEQYDDSTVVEQEVDQTKIAANSSREEEVKDSRLDPVDVERGGGCVVEDILWLPPVRGAGHLQHVVCVA